MSYVKGLYPIGTVMEVCSSVHVGYRAKIASMRIERTPHSRPLHIYTLEGLQGVEFPQGNLAEARHLDWLRNHQQECTA